MNRPRDDAGDVLDTLLTAEDWEALLEREQLRRGRTGERLAIALIDVDDLGWIRSHISPEVADAALQACARVLTTSVRGADVVARVGDSEFGVLLHGTDSERAGAWGERFERRISDHAHAEPRTAFSCVVALSCTEETDSLLVAHEKARRQMEGLGFERRLRRMREDIAGSGEQPE